MRGKRENNDYTPKQNGACDGRVKRNWLRSFVRTWTSDLKDRHIRSNVISPGPTDTPVIDGQPANAIARIVSTIPMGRMGKPDEIAKAALFLASDDSSFITGIELFVDGGRGQI
jgi:NAD(P)-dependent dehydrogenase (short-subunit alcohol dehydrogenase family)